VLRPSASNAPSRNPGYRGIDRMPPFNQDRWNEGFDWPTMSRQLVDENLLSPDLARAEKVIEGFGWLHPSDDLEILFVRSGDRPGLTAATRPASQFLGFDTAGPAPFYSVLADPPLDPLADQHIDRLNEFGLFPNDTAATRYLADLRQAGLVEANQVLFVWTVELVRQR
jgi:hypothetical protein